jgi:hypothetical protein
MRRRLEPQLPPSIQQQYACHQPHLSVVPTRVCEQLDAGRGRSWASCDLLHRCGPTAHHRLIPNISEAPLPRRLPARRTTSTRMAELAAAGKVLQIFSTVHDVYDTCDRIYQGVKLTRALGSDFECVQARLQVQWGIFTSIAERVKIAHRSGGPLDERKCRLENVRTIKEATAAIQHYFQTCHKIIAKYGARQMVNTTSHPQCGLWNAD